MTKETKRNIVLSAICLTAFIMPWAICYAIHQRGYWSMGGEWLLILIPIWVVVILSCFPDMPEKLKWKRSPSRAESIYVDTTHTFDIVKFKLFTYSWALCYYEGGLIQSFYTLRGAKKYANWYYRNRVKK